MDTKNAVALALALCKATYPNIGVSSETHTVWCVLLSDLDPPVIPQAVLTALRESAVPTLPAIGRIREIALRLMGQYITPSQAYLLTRARIQEQMGADAQYHYRLDTSDLPDRVRQTLTETVRRVGIRALKEVDSVGMQARFERIYREVFREVVQAPPVITGEPKLSTLIGDHHAV